MATSNPTQEAVLNQVGLQFELHKELVVQAKYYRANAVFMKDVGFLVGPVPLRECDGTVLKAGDQKMLATVADLGKDFQPVATDYVDVGTGKEKYDVLAGVLDWTSSFWTLFVRRRMGG